MNRDEKIEYARLRADGARLFNQDLNEATEWQDAVRELEQEEE